MTDDVRTKYNQFLENLAGTLDISPSKYQVAVDRYSAVGKWLMDGSYNECINEPKVYVQGSFRLGTVVRPVREGKESDYDIDLVCELQKNKEIAYPKEVKHEIGNRLKSNATYSRLLDKEGRRCWTLKYAEDDGIGFHLDILPSVTEDNAIISMLMSAGVTHGYASQAIAITHNSGKDEYFWSAGNPGGYANWFDVVKKPAFTRIVATQKQRLFEHHHEIFAKIDDVPDQLIRTPLQRVIQILKRHRDIRFAGKIGEEDKPISMIITTLSARLYENEEDIYSALKNIIEKLEAHARLITPGFQLNEQLASRKIIIRTREGKWYIPNPVNPYENFADRWHEEDHKKAKSFFQWVSWIRRDLVDVLAKGTIQKITESLATSFGENTVTAASSGLLLFKPTVMASIQSETPHIVIRNPSKPWGRNS